MDNNQVEEGVPSSNHGNAAEGHMDEVVSGLSGVMISNEDKKRYALDLLKNLCEDDMITNRDLGIETENDITLPDLNESLATATLDEPEFEENIIGSVEHAELAGTPPIKVADELIASAASKTFETTLQPVYRKRSQLVENKWTQLQVNIFKCLTNSND